LGKNISDLIELMAFSLNSVRFFKIIAHNQRYKNVTYVVYKKIYLGWKVMKLGRQKKFGISTEDEIVI